jgi:hypothetical protein
LRGGVAIFARRQRAGAAVREGALTMLQDVGVGGLLFHLLWGFGYTLPPLEHRLHWAEPDAGTERSGDTESLIQLARRTVDAANDAYRALHASDDLGFPTPGGHAERVEAAVEIGWQHVALALALPPPAASDHGPIKHLLLSPLLRRAGLSGFYAPFTGEANVNRSVPAVSYALTVGHEKAHQRGVHREDEANFLGWLATASAPDPLARYSAAVFAQRQLLMALIPRDEEAARALIALRVPGVQRDIDDLRAYWSLSDGPTGRIARRVNDAYLRSNRVEEGVASYGRSVVLLLEWAERHGGELPAVASPAVGGSDARISRTLCASASSVNGFCRKDASDADTPWRTMPSSL